MTLALAATCLPMAYMLGARNPPLRRTNGAVAFDNLLDAAIDETDTLHARLLSLVANDDGESTASPALPNSLGGLPGGRWPSRLDFKELDTLFVPTVDDVSLGETEDGYLFTIKATHGSSGPDLSVSVDDDTLTVTGKAIGSEDGARFRSSFRWSLPLPADADSTLHSTTYEDDGVVVSVPKLIGAAADEQSEAEALAAESPRLARWLRAHGYLPRAAEEDDIDEVDVEFDI